MNNPIPFDLNLDIQNWRESLAQSSAFRSENLNELESHLRDSITKLEASGLTDEEAFTVATKRIGKSEGLENEFSKVNQSSVWLDRILWMLIGVQVWGLVTGIVNSLTRNALIFGWSGTNQFGQDISLALPVTVSVLAQVLAIAASIALCWWLIVGNGQRIGKWIGSLLEARSSLILLAAGLSVLWLVGNLLSVAGNIIWARTLSPGQFGRMSMGLSLSLAIVTPVQIIAMIVLTLVLARKRLCASRT